MNTSQIHAVHNLLNTLTPVETDALLESLTARLATLNNYRYVPALNEEDEAAARAFLIAMRALCWTPGNMAYLLRRDRDQ